MVYSKVQTTGYIQEQGGQIRLYHKISKRFCKVLKNNFFGHFESKINLQQNDGKSMEKERCIPHYLSDMEAMLLPVEPGH